MRTRLGGLAAIAALVTSGLTGSALADPADVPVPGSRANAIAQDARADEASAALAKVAAIFAGTPEGSARAEGHAGHGREATLALRDLAVLKGSLTGAERAAAERYLARPTDGVSDPQGDGYSVAEATPLCGTYVCIHYVATTADAPPLTDTTPAPNGIPDWVEFARNTLDSVATTYVGAGYKDTKDDSTSTNTGGNGLTDIYLADIGDDGLYGYCTTDDPATSVPGEYDFSAYCVLDNDYHPGQYGTANTPAENFQVTAAHEYFHAVQYAYDALEDGWFMEASATWAEDELFDAVDDNVFYLDEGQLAKPWIPLDKFGSGVEEGLFHYGNWIFLRYLTEKYAGETGGMPTLMRDLWNRVDAAAPSDPDMWAIQAIKSALTARNTSFTRQYALFADAGRRRSSFSEGVANNYPVKPLGGIRTLSTSKKSTGWLQVTGGQDHMTNLTLRVVPNSSLNASAWRLRVELDLAATFKGTAAVVTVYKQSGGQTVTTIPLNDQGNKTMAFKFGRTDVKWVEITTVNASTRFECFVPPYNSPYSCLGTPKDDNLKALLKATAFR